MNNNQSGISENGSQLRFPRLWIQILALIIVFICGGISGAFLMVQQARNHITKMISEPDIAREQIVKELKKRLSLDEYQVAQVAEIVMKRHSAMIAVRRDTAPLLLKEFDAMEAETLAVLNARQKEEFIRISQFIRSAFLLQEKSPESRN